MKSGILLRRIINAEILGRNSKLSLSTLEIKAGKIDKISTQRKIIPKNENQIILDAKGCILLPGLTDHHTHPFALAANRRTVDLRNCRSIIELQNRLRASLSKIQKNGSKIAK